MNKKQIRFVAIGLLALTFSTAAQALHNELVVTGIENAKIVVKSGGGLAAVQPTATLQFDYSSCKNQNFAVLVSAPKSGPTQLMVVSKDELFDCFGPHVKRTYSLQISSDAKMGTSYVLTNTLAVEYVSPISIPDGSIALPPVTIPNPVNEDICLKELEAEIKRKAGEDGFEDLKPVSKKEAEAMLSGAPWDEIGDNELTNAKVLLSYNSSLAYSMSWTAPSNSGTSIVIVPNKNNCKSYVDYVTWSEE